MCYRGYKQSTSTYSRKHLNANDRDIQDSPLPNYSINNTGTRCDGYMLNPMASMFVPERFGLRHLSGFEPSNQIIHNSNHFIDHTHPSDTTYPMVLKEISISPSVHNLSTPIMSDVSEIEEISLHSSSLLTSPLVLLIL